MILSDRFLIRQSRSKEGIIEIRKGVPELDLGERKYAMVHIQIGYSNHYIKGMAVYAPDEEFPDGIDVIFYTHLRSDGTFVGYGTWGKHERKKPLKIIDESEYGWKEYKDRLASKTCSMMKKNNKGGVLK